ncbi:MAG: hypothetical protein HOU81_07330 [Hamadaea sp.]|uniref:hypothetical protein n=1 Tax=Hamadaea sp. TaxID=2024425 RepID=UPI0017D7E31E|nr:hypothetical protein [Hamadaea sp.]NUR70616.1 hypothetical protein [Hamadaea sp.]NUT22354.1 hypothetical protein [Hamadaea sp.]
MVVQFLADNNFGDTRSGGLAGPMGLLLIVVLGIATVLLIRNMSKRIKRLPTSFTGERPEGLPAQAIEHEKSSGSADVVEQVKPRQDNSR